MVVDACLACRVAFEAVAYLRLLTLYLFPTLVFVIRRRSELTSRVMGSRHSLTYRLKRSRSSFCLSAAPGLSVLAGQTNRINSPF